jgi:hypothetical protein
MSPKQFSEFVAKFCQPLTNERITAALLNLLGLLPLPPSLAAWASSAAALPMLSTPAVIATITAAAATIYAAQIHHRGGEMQ